MAEAMRPQTETLPVFVIVRITTTIATTRIRAMIVIVVPTDINNIPILALVYR